MQLGNCMTQLPSYMVQMETVTTQWSGGSWLLLGQKCMCDHVRKQQACTSKDEDFSQPHRGQVGISLADNNKVVYTTAPPTHCDKYFLCVLWRVKKNGDIQQLPNLKQKGRVGMGSRVRGNGACYIPQSEHTHFTQAALFD